MISEDIPERVKEDPAYKNARTRPDRANARIEHDKALGRVLISLMKDDAQLYKQFSDNDGFKRWLKNEMFNMTYAGAPESAPPSVA